jgi:sulfide:quinone oxidoreductase
MAGSDRFQVLIAGAGVAAIESAVALRELAGPRVAITLLAPDREFLHWPSPTPEGSMQPGPERIPLVQIADALEAELIGDSASWVQRVAQLVHTAAGDELGYDALILCLGAVAHRRYEHAVTIEDRSGDDLRRLLDEVGGGEVRRVAFIATERMAWTLPLYEFALRSATRARESAHDVRLTLLTSEVEPLQVFGTAASREVAELLREHGIELVRSVHCEVPEPGRIVVSRGQAQGERWVTSQARPRARLADRILTMPELHGPPLRGVPRARNGFIPVNPQCRVRGAQRVYAAGDATDFPIKHGGIATQQAEVAATSIAALAGASVRPRTFRAWLEGTLFTGTEARYLSAVLTGGHSFSSEISAEPIPGHAAVLSADRLGTYLDGLGS